MTTIDYERMAREAGLERVGARPRFTAYVRELWDRRSFALTLARYRIEATLGDNRLGLAWVVLRPMFQAAVFGLVFGLIMPRSTRDSDVAFIPFLVTGVFVFGYFSQSFSAGAKSITGNANLVRSLSFPRMLLPVAAVLQQLFEMVAIMAVLAVILIAFGEPITVNWLLVPVILGLMTLFNAGVALVSARLTVHLRDVAQLIPYLTRLLFYSSGIFYSLELVLEDRPTILMIAQLNPVHAYLTLVRAQMVEGVEANAQMWVVAAVSAVVVLAFGLWFFWKAEERYGHD